MTLEGTDPPATTAKETLGGFSPPAFTFTSDGGAFSLSTTAAGVTGEASTTFNGLPAGSTFTTTETPVPGSYDLTSLTCDDGTTGSTSTGAVTVTVPLNATTTCTYVRHEALRGDPDHEDLDEGQRAPRRGHLRHLDRPRGCEQARDGHHRCDRHTGLVRKAGPAVGTCRTCRRHSSARSSSPR